MFSGFSVIVPTYERAEQLGRCLEALAAQAYPSIRFEVIVVNDGGSPVSQPDTPLPMIGSGTLLLHQKNQGPGAARNHGANHARFSHLAFTDDDCEPDNDWLYRLEESCQRYPCSMVGGITRNRLQHDLYSETSQAIVSAAYRWHNPVSDRARFLASNNMVCPREEFISIGGFDPSFRAAEDRDLCDRWLQAGWTIVQTDHAQINHSHQLSAVDFWNQHRSYGRGAFRYHRAKAARTGNRHTFDVTFFGFLIIEPFRRRPSARSMIIAFLSILSQVASLHGYIEALMQSRR